MQEKIEKIIIDTLKELNEELENEAFLNPNSKTKHILLYFLIIN